MHSEPFIQSTLQETHSCICEGDDWSPYVHLLDCLFDAIDILVDTETLLSFMQMEA